MLTEPPVALSLMVLPWRDGINGTPCGFGFDHAPSGESINCTPCGNGNNNSHNGVRALTALPVAVALRELPMVLVARVLLLQGGQKALR